MELERVIVDAQLKGSNVVDEEGSKYAVTKNSSDKLSAEYLPWLEKTKANNPANNLADKAAAWEQMFGKSK